jgi:tetratricopeptide (TPR) repeat protein
MRHRASLLTLALVLAAAPAWAAREWYAYYDDALKAIARGQHGEALISLRRAQEMKPRSALQEQTYGLDFVDYFPYYYQGKALARMGQHAAAVDAFNAEEKQGAIKSRPREYGDLVKLRSEAAEKAREIAEAQESARKARVALAEVRRLRQEGEELHRDGKLEEALARLAEAQKVAELLEGPQQDAIRERAQKIRQELNVKQEQAARAERIEKALEAGRKLLSEAKAPEAKIKFEEVLTLEPRHAAALEGREAAEAQILAFTTQQERAAQLAEGRKLVESGQYEKALKPLAEAAADPQNAEALTLFQKAQKTLERFRKAKDVRQRLDDLMKDGEAFLAARKFAEAMVAFDSVLELDPTHPRVAHRKTYAERMTAERITEKIFPNQPPVFTFINLPLPEVDAGRVAIGGIASDDRGLALIEYRLGEQVLSRQAYDPDRETGQLGKIVRLAHVFPLEPGANRISVVAVDSSDVKVVESFDIYRRLRFYETKAFLPSAVAGAFGLVGLGYVAQRARRQRAVRRRFNPYIAGAPVMAGEMFFGRQKLLSRILNVLHHNSLMITGERRIGKTTFLYRLKAALEADEGTEYQFFPVFTDLQGVTEEGFFHAVMSDVLDNLKLAAASLPGLRFHADAEHYDGRDFSHDMQRVIEHLKANTTRKVKLVLLIDEVDVLNEYSERINQRLRGIFMKNFAEHLAAIMSGVGIKRTWTSEGSPWYNFFDEIELTAFSREEAEALIRQPVEDVFRWEPEAVEKILEASALKPYVIQKYCIHAVNRMLEQERTTITAEDVEAVRDDVNFEGREVPAAPASRRPAQASA